MLDQVVDNPLDREDPHRAAGLVYHRQMAISPPFHVSHRDADGVLGIDADRVRGHALGYRDAHWLPSRENATHQVAFCENADYPAALTDQQASDMLVPHEFDCLGDCLLGPYLSR